MYKEAIRMGLRVLTSKGSLSIEQLWTLSLTDLKNAIKAVKKLLTKDNDDELSFLVENKVIDVENQLRFDILKDIYMTKQSEIQASQTAQSVKEHNQKIDMLIAAKKAQEMENMSIEDLEKLRK
jgi:hypothetical protein